MTPEFDLTPKFDCALAASVLEATLRLDFCERQLLAALLQCAEWNGRDWLVDYDEFRATPICRALNFPPYLNLVMDGFIVWRRAISCLQIDPEKLMPPSEQQEAT